MRFKEDYRRIYKFFNGGVEDFEVGMFEIFGRSLSGFAFPMPVVA
jgi:hypothetical protein